MNQHILLRQQYEAGLNSVLEFAGDLIVDIPKVWDYFGELIGKLKSQIYETEQRCPTRSLLNTWDPFSNISKVLCFEQN